jgi:hypothetical protein
LADSLRRIRGGICDGPLAMRGPMTAGKEYEWEKPGERRAKCGCDCGNHAGAAYNGERADPDAAYLMQLGCYGVLSE